MDTNAYWRTKLLPVESSRLVPNTNNNITYSGEDTLNGRIIRAPTANSVDTLPAASVINALIANVTKESCFHLSILNNSAFQITVAMGSGGVLDSSAEVKIPEYSTGKFIVVISNSGVDSYTVYRTNYVPPLTLNRVESNPTTITTRTSFVQKARLTIEAEDADYIIYYSGEVGSKNRSTAVKTRLELDDATTIFQSSKRPFHTSDVQILSGFYVTTLTAGTHTIDFDFCSSSSRRGVFARRVRLAAHRIT